MAPKRENLDDGEEGKPSKRPRRGNKSENEPREDEPEKNTPKKNNVDEGKKEEEEITKEGRKNAGKFVLASGNVDPPKLNVKDPSKLTLHFRHVATNTRKTLKFQRKAAKDINWSNKEDIQMIQKWRRQILRRQGFPIEREVTGWVPREKSFIELLFRLLQQLLDAGKQVSAPSNPQISKHLNTFFKGKILEDGFIHPGHRNGHMVTTQLRDGTALGKATKKTRDALKDGKKGRKLVIDLPRITDQQLDDFIANPNMDLQSLKEPPKAVVSESTAQPVGSGPPNSPSVPIINSGLIEGPGIPDTVIESPPRGGDAHGPIESPTHIYSRADREQMRKDGWSIPAIPETSNTTKIVDDDADTLNDEWMYKTVDALHDRWSDSSTNQFGYHAPITKSRKWKNYRPAGKRAGWYEDVDKNAPKTDIMVSTRRPFAQAVNGLLNLAICPPVGDFGDMKSPALGKRDRFDRAFFHEHQRALQFHREKSQARIDRYWDMDPKSKRAK